MHLNKYILLITIICGYSAQVYNMDVNSGKAIIASSMGVAGVSLCYHGIKRFCLEPKNMNSYVFHAGASSMSGGASSTVNVHQNNAILLTAQQESKEVKRGLTLLTLGFFGIGISWNILSSLTKK